MRTKKKNLTGAELGKLLISESFKWLVSKGHPRKSPYSEDEITAMIKALSAEEYEVFNNYRLFNKWIMEYFPLVDSMLKDLVIVAMDRIAVLQSALRDEDYHYFRSKLPVIVSESRYKELVKENREQILRGKEITALVLVGKAIDRLVRYANQGKKNVIADFKERYEQENFQPSTDLVEIFNRWDGNGYFELEDGTRSDKVSEEEWQEAVDRLCGLNGIEGISKVINDWKAVYKGNGSLFEREIPALESKIKWHSYSTLPTDLTRWDFMEALGDLIQLTYLDAIQAKMKGDSKEEKRQIEILQELLDEFSEALEALYKDMARYFPSIENTEIGQWLSTFKVTDKELYELDFYEEKNEVDNGFTSLNGKQFFENGVAVYKGIHWREDERGDFQPRDIKLEDTLTDYFTESENYADHVKRLEREAKIIKSNYSILEAYNTVIDMATELYGVASLPKVKTDMLKQMFEKAESLTYLLFNRINIIDYTDHSIKEKKLTVLRDLLTPYKLEGVKQSAKRLKEVKQSMVNFDCFKEATPFSNPVMQLLGKPPPSFFGIGKESR